MAPEVRKSYRFLYLFGSSGSPGTFIPVSFSNNDGSVNWSGDWNGNDSGSGGASGGIRDLTSSIIEELGEVKIHGIAIQPGKPTIIGLIDGKPIFGLPGYPTSCLTNFTLLVAPLLRKLLGRESEVRKVKKRLAHKVFSVKGRRQFLPVRIEGEKAVPILKGSGAVTSFIEADGFIEVPENVEILEAGEEVEVTFFG
jgi:molybdopterin molybdotransferase